MKKNLPISLGRSESSLTVNSSNVSSTCETSAHALPPEMPPPDEAYTFGAPKGIACLIPSFIMSIILPKRMTELFSQCFVKFHINVI